MYELRVYYSQESAPRESLRLEAAAAVLKALPGLLAGHPECFRVEVRAGLHQLFNVDCRGDRLAE